MGSHSEVMGPRPEISPRSRGTRGESGARPPSPSRAGARTRIEPIGFCKRTSYLFIVRDVKEFIFCLLSE